MPAYAPPLSGEILVGVHSIFTEVVMLHSLKPEHFVIPPNFKHFASAQNAKAISATETASCLLRTTA